LLVAALAARPAWGIVELDGNFGVTDADYIAQGAEYPEVGNFSNAGIGLVSGVLIAPDWVLTAGHVGVSLTPGTSDFNIGGETYVVSAVIVYPTFNGTDLQDDLSLVELSTNVANVTPASIYTGSSELTVTGVWTGFGQSGTGLTGATGNRGTLRGATNVIDAFYTPSNSSVSLLDGTTILADFDDGTLANNTLAAEGSSPVPTSLEGSLASGDSGGGVFADIGGNTVLIGINSFIGAGNSGGSDTQYGAFMGATRVSSYSTWIDSEIPEPATDGLILGSVAVLLGLARSGWRRKPAN
jgi:secreted trypsin-like serine protease